jgi:hypothetical protein
MRFVHSHGVQQRNGEFLYRDKNTKHRHCFLFEIIFLAVGEGPLCL